MISRNLIAIISFIIVLLNFNRTYGQQYEMKKQLSPDEKAALLDISKDLFTIDPTFGYTISAEEVLSSFSKIKEVKKSVESDLVKLENLLSKDSLNPITLFFIGNYYSEKGSPTIAKSYFQKAYENLNEVYFKNDSSRFYSLRGLLKFKLNYENSDIDFEKSLSINPNDSLALAIYPIELIMKGNWSVARNLCVNLLERKNISNFLPYLYLIIVEELDALQSLIQEIKVNKNAKLEYQRKDYTQMFDFDLIDKYAERLSDTAEMKNARVMADVFALFMKLMVFERADHQKPILSYTPNDLSKLAQLEQWLMEASNRNQMNEYTRNKNLGYVSYMLDHSDKAIDYFTQAIEIFPLSKRSDTFSPNESFEALQLIYHFKNDTTNYRKILQRKISIEPPNLKSVADYRNLAFHYFLNGENEKAGVWGKKASSIDSNDFETLRLLAHLYFLKGMDFMTRFYFEDMTKLVVESIQGYEYCLQLAVYELYKNNAPLAMGYLKLSKDAFSEAFPNNRNCELCDRLIANYIQVIK